MSFVDPLGAQGEGGCDPILDPFCGCDPSIDPFCNGGGGGGSGGGGNPERPRKLNLKLIAALGIFRTLGGGSGIAIRHSAYKYSGRDRGRCTWTPTCTGTCSSPHTTNPDPETGVCYTHPFKQCYDLVANGKCESYRIFCYGTDLPGTCD